MTKIIAPAVPQVGQEINVHIGSPTRIGNAVSIYVEDKRVALGRVVEEHDQNDKYTLDIHGHEGKVHSAKNIFGIVIEHIFGQE